MMQEIMKQLEENRARIEEICTILETEKDERRRLVLIHELMDCSCKIDALKHMRKQAQNLEKLKSLLNGFKK